MPAAVIRKRLGVHPVLGEAVHLPRLAKEATGPAILWTLTLVMRHRLRPHPTAGRSWPLARGIGSVIFLRVFLEVLVDLGSVIVIIRERVVNLGKRQVRELANQLIG